MIIYIRSEFNEVSPFATAQFFVGSLVIHGIRWEGDDSIRNGTFAWAWQQGR
jgi:hypothetical protein